MAEPTIAADLTTAFRDAMRRMASTVTIITATDFGRHHGMTVTALTSVSMNPPSLLACLNNRTHLHDIMGAGPAVLRKCLACRTSRTVGRVQRCASCRGTL